ncbi:ferritin-like domain-containing protein [Lihuaxuella thermophila]|uniref:Bacterioferritin n=1 Tax=Lihuaxuella thermophila TaxID=1173111 RepID=A0A1H8AV13_9BACL|nr:ferritin-like domain-containing protein [Lihuaxuella thermophila]SEM73794.1 bacterioferritin [Lihuaxuella thermophila]
MDAKQALIDGLNEDLAYELSAINQYIYNAAVVSGLARLTLRNLFAKEAQDEMGHAQYLAEKIAALGGEPVVQPKPFSHSRNVKEMLEATIQAEIDTIDRYTERLEQADAVQDIELKTRLEDIIADETKHKEEMLRLLEDPRL